MSLVTSCRSRTIRRVELLVQFRRGQNRAVLHVETGAGERHGNRVLRSRLTTANTPGRDRQAVVVRHGAESGRAVIGALGRGEPKQQPDAGRKGVVNPGALAAVVAVVVDDQILEIVEGDLERSARSGTPGRMNASQRSVSNSSIARPVRSWPVGFPTLGHEPFLGRPHDITEKEHAYRPGLRVSSTQTRRAPATNTKAATPFQKRSLELYPEAWPKSQHRNTIPIVHEMTLHCASSGLNMVSVSLGGSPQVMATFGAR